MEKKWKILIVASCVTPVIFMFLYSLNLPSKRREFLQDSFTAILIKKYRDSSNHDVRTIVIKKTTDYEPTKLILLDDTSFYNISRPNDSIVKIKGGQVIKVVRPDGEFIVPIVFRPD